MAKVRRLTRVGRPLMLRPSPIGAPLRMSDFAAAGKSDAKNKMQMGGI
jgi:hypothetical protein